MKKILSIGILFLATCAQAAWYWPFTSSEDNTNRPPRLHRLLEKANDFIELAEDETVNGEADKALDYYYQALDELRRVQFENPDRADTPEFAPLRNKIAACKAAVDTIRFEQVNANIRAVSVTDTTELQRKWYKKHGIVDKEDEPPPKPEVKTPETVTEAPSPPDAGAEVPVASAESWSARLSEVARKLRAGETAAAEEALTVLLGERPDDLNALLLQGAVLANTGRYYAARKALEKAAQAHPKSYVPHYNLAYVALELGEGRKVAKEHYDAGRELGGPVNADIETRLQDE